MFCEVFHQIGVKNYRFQFALERQAVSFSGT